MASQPLSLDLDLRASLLAALCSWGESVNCQLWEAFLPVSYMWAVGQVPILLLKAM